VRDKEKGVERIDERKGRGRRFQREGLIDGNNLVRAIVALTRGRKRSRQQEDRRGRREETEIVKR